MQVIILSQKISERINVCKAVAVRCRMTLGDGGVCVGMIIIVLNDTTNATDTTDLTAWFRSAQDSSPLLFNGLQLYRHNDSLVVLFAAGKSSLFELVHYAVYMAKVYFNKLRT